MQNQLKSKTELNRVDPLILAVDTSCDETSVAILQGRRVLSSVISSQVELHKKWGGVVPDIARRAHQENLPLVYQEALKRARVSIGDIDYVAVTYGPGLAIALEVGVDFAKKLAYDNNKKFIPVNHMEGHMLSSFILNKAGKQYKDFKEEIKSQIRNPKSQILNPISNIQFPISNIFPFISVLISGSHTDLVLVNKIGDYSLLGETLDDAAGECFDKVSRMLNLGYPGGPIITYLAGKGDKKKADEFKLPVPMEKSGDLNFSYSGLKTACLYKIQKIRAEGRKESEWTSDFCLAFINSVSKSIQIKLKKAIEQNPEVKAIVLGGGVINNRYIVRDLVKCAKNMGLPCYFPEIKYRGDNAAMIGVAAYFELEQFNKFLEGEEILKVDRVPGLGVENKL